jgi:hypothetical protein
MAAVATGSAMAGALGASRASRLLFAASRRADMGGLVESLAMVLALAGPYSRQIRAEFISSRRDGSGLTASFTKALASVDDLDMKVSGEELQARNGISLALAFSAWLLLLGAVAGVI